MAPPIATSVTQGLSSAQAAQRLIEDGPNAIAASAPASSWMIAWRVLTEPMTMLLIACGTIYLILGDWREAMVLSAFVVVMILISFYQEQKTERALDALRDMANPRAKVQRDGVTVVIPASEVVVGDILFLSEGDRIAADGVLVSCLNLQVDESLLTGESLAVNKIIDENLLQVLPMSIGQAGGEASPYVFSGSMAVQGQGVAQVICTGNRTAIGKIGSALFEIKEEPTRVQQEATKIVKIVAAGSIALAIILALWYGYTRADWLRGTLVGITFAMAMIPEELPVVLTLFLGIGAWRIAQKRVLTRRVPVIETLGSATVLCVDKTGTLTQNHMAVRELYAMNTSWSNLDAASTSLPEDLHTVLEYGILASHRQAFDPMELAINQAGLQYLSDTEHLHQEWTLVEEYPLSRELLAMSRVWRSTDAAATNQYIIASKGAPEAIIDLCHLSASLSQHIMREVTRMAEQGLRVLGVAQARFVAAQKTSVDAENQLPELQHDFDFEFAGLIGFADPIRVGVPEAIKECRSAGIRTIMITGDFPATAQNVAKQCGIDTAGGMLSGPDLSTMNDQALAHSVKNVNIYCRVTPEQKLRLVNALKANHEIVAMTGDGINDAPALKSAHIGIAMCKRGTEVAREAASLILLDDDFSSIVAAVKLGRRIFDNLRKSIAYIVAVHIPIIGLSFIPVMMGWPILLMPVHILVLELIIDPSCSLVFEAEPEEANIMQRPPRPFDSSIFDTAVMVKAVLQGAVLLACTLGVYVFSTSHGIDIDQARAMAFSAIVVGNLGMILINRHLNGNLFTRMQSKNPILPWVLISASALLILALTLPSLSELFFFGHPSLAHIVLSVLAAMLSVIVVSMAQMALHRK